MDALIGGLVLLGIGLGGLFLMGLGAYLFIGGASDVWHQNDRYRR